MIDVPYRAGGGSVLRYQYGYDEAGNRLFARIDKQGDAEDWLYRYDVLNRLIRASRGILNTNGDGFEEDTSAHTITWNLDLIGNWSGGNNQVSVQRFTDGDANGGYHQGFDSDLVTDHHNTDQLNQIDSRVIGDETGPGDPIKFAYDEAGNLIFDGTRYYVYDAWNRLTEIDGPGNLEVDQEGQLTGTPGPTIARYEYDALGRRVKTITYEAGQPVKTTRHVFGSGPEVLEEYDLEVDMSEISELENRNRAITA